MIQADVQEVATNTVMATYKYSYKYRRTPHVLIRHEYPTTLTLLPEQEKYRHAKGANSVHASSAGYVINDISFGGDLKVN